MRSQGAVTGAAVSSSPGARASAPPGTCMWRLDRPPPGWARRSPCAARADCPAPAPASAAFSRRGRDWPSAPAAMQSSYGSRASGQAAAMRFAPPCGARGPPGSGPVGWYRRRVRGPGTHGSRSTPAAWGRSRGPGPDLHACLRRMPARGRRRARWRRPDRRPARRHAGGGAAPGCTRRRHLRPGARLARVRAAGPVRRPGPRHGDEPGLAGTDTASSRHLAQRPHHRLATTGCRA